MYTIDGINLPKGWTRVTVNGAHITAKTSSGELYNIRKPEMGIWYDEKHRKLMEAFFAVEKALSNLLD